MSGPWAVWDDCPLDWGMDIDAEEFPTYRQAAAEVRSFLAEMEEWHLRPGPAKRLRKRECDGGENEWCEGGCVRDGGPDDHTVEHDVWAFTLKERKGMECGDPRP